MINKLRKGGQKMGSFIELAEERIKSKTKKVSLGELLFKAPEALVGLLVSMFPLSFPVFYVIALLFMK
jgi:hypothetical protein